MSKYILIRHGEPDYSDIGNYGFFGYGRDFAPLSEKGIVQVEKTAKDKRLADADIIVTSPYTRALQSAQIISKETGIPVVVELGLHEWFPDLTNCYQTSEEAVSLAEEFVRYKGEYPSREQMKWETLAAMRKRMRSVADKYARYDKVILVSHGMALRTLAYIEEMEPAQMIECEYAVGQADCEYSFY